MSETQVATAWHTNLPRSGSSASTGVLYLSLRSSAPIPTCNMYNIRNLHAPANSF